MRVVGLTTVIVLALIAIAAWGPRTGVWDRVAGLDLTGRYEADRPDDVIRYVSTLAKGELTPIAAMATEIGHWRLANRASEVITAAGRSEITQALRTLSPETGGRPEKIHIHLAPDSLFHHAKLVDELPRTGRMSVVVDGQALPIRTLRDGTLPRYQIEAAPGLFIETNDRRMFAEMAWQLRRPVHKVTVQSLALAPSDLAVSGRALQDLGKGFVILTGRLSGEQLAYKAVGGGEGSISIADLWRAAEQADANLIVLSTTSPRQQGSRNWFWQRTALSNAEKALAAQKLGQLIRGLAGDAADVTVTGGWLGNQRMELQFARASRTAAGTSIAETLKGTVSDIVAQAAGSLTIIGMQATLTRSHRQIELERRLLPSVPSAIQFGYLALVAIGLLALPVLGSWWRNIWPQEEPKEYGSAIALSLARAVRGTLFAGLFLPAAALPALLVRLAGCFGRPTSSEAGMKGENQITPV